MKKHHMVKSRPPATLTAKQINEMVGAVACDGSTAFAIASELVSRFEHLQAEVARLQRWLSETDTEYAAKLEAADAELAITRAEVARLTQERDKDGEYWQRAENDLAAEQSLRQAAEARLTAQAAALEALEQEIRAAQHSAYEVAGPKSPRGHDYKRWADRLATLRTPEGR